MSHDVDAFFMPFKAGALELPNRVVMAPLTRNRATPKTLAPHALNAEYYAQRASAGLIVTEATQISREAQGYAWTPGVYSDEQIEGWKQVTDAVHARGGRIVLQIWHVGRISHPDLLPGNATPVAPSAVRPAAKTFTETGFKDVETPRELELDEIPGLVAQFGAAAANAKTAGFDGVEIHGANGYLVDQFLRDGTNKRSDAYGGSIENRARFLLESTEAAAKAFGADRVGVRLSPLSPFNDISPMRRRSFRISGSPISTSSRERPAARGKRAASTCRRCVRRSRAPISETTAMIRRSPRPASRPARSISSPSASCLSRIRISSDGSRAARRSRSRTRRRSMAAAPKATPTIRSSKPPERRQDRKP